MLLTAGGVLSGYGSGPSSAGSLSAPAPVTMVVDPATGHQAISPLIYGINDDASLDTAFATNQAKMNPTLDRLGGNRWTAYNWTDNLSNAGSDYEYESDDYLSSSTAPGAAVLPTVQADETRGVTTLVTIPVNGYVASVATVGSVENTPNYLQLDFKVEQPGDADTANQAVNPSSPIVYQNQFVTWLKNTAPGAKVMFALDNEPDLWDSTHSEVHPAATTYAEILADDLSYAEAIHAVDPNALITGPVSYGYEGYISLQQAPDSAADGNFLDWYLAQVKAADRARGYAVIDDLDLHWYPEATGNGARITDTGTSPAESAAREQAPRSLWDPTYVEDSWITQWFTNPVSGRSAIDLIPTLKAQIAANDPGTKLDFSEWNYGGGQDISGGIATADVLGIFGRYGVHAAAWWPLNPVETYSRAAFAVFRNYDGHDSTFGDTSVTATTTDPVNTSVYGSIDSDNPSRVVIVAVNKNNAPTVTTLHLTGGYSTSRASVYTLTSAGPQVEPAGVISATSSATFTYTMPAQSVSVIVPAPAAPNGCPSTDGTKPSSASGIAAVSVGGCPGYVAVDGQGQVWAFGSAHWYGDLSTVHLAAPIIAIQATPDGGGYWLLGADGGIFNYGDARFYGSTGGLKLAAPVVGMAVTTTGDGYWMVAKDGGVFSYGDARFYGSTGGLKLAQPVDGIAVAPGGRGYWLVASDGGVFASPRTGSTDRWARPGWPSRSSACPVRPTAGVTPSSDPTAACSVSGMHRSSDRSGATLLRPPWWPYPPRRAMPGMT
jgi:hypothetical protein